LPCFICSFVSQIIDKYCDYRCSDRTVSVWEWRSGHGFEEKSYSPLTHHKYMVTGVQFDGDATLLATSSLDGSTTLCDVEVKLYIIIILFIRSGRLVKAWHKSSETMCCDDFLDDYKNSNKNTCASAPLLFL